MSDTTPRRAPGRPKGTTDPDARRKIVAVRLSNEELAKARMLGSGNASLGMRIALKCHGASTAEQLRAMDDAR